MGEVPTTTRQEIAFLLDQRSQLIADIQTRKIRSDLAGVPALESDLKQLESHLNKISIRGRPKSENKTLRRLSHAALKQRLRRLRELLEAKGMPTLAQYLDQTVTAEAGMAWRYTPIERISWDISAE